MIKEHWSLTINTRWKYYFIGLGANTIGETWMILKGIYECLKINQKNYIIYKKNKDLLAKEDKGLNYTVMWIVLILLRWMISLA